MRKIALTILLSLTMMLAFFGLAGCGGYESATGESGAASPSGEISVISREDGSGTRGAFVELVGIEEKDASGQSTDMTTPSAVITNSTSVMMTTVAGDENAIGYISLGSLNDTVKALEVDGVAATTENVKSGNYTVSRPFNIVTRMELSPESQDFIDFILSSDGQAIVEENGYIAVDENATAYSPSDMNGRIVVAGSSSVTPVMEKLAEAYEVINPNMTVEVNQSDSTTGVNSIIDGTADIGMASRELKDSETAAGVFGKAIAQDGIAIIVNPASSFQGLSTDQIKAIYTGEITDWNQVS